MYHVTVEATVYNPPHRKDIPLFDKRIAFVSYQLYAPASIKSNTPPTSTSATAKQELVGQTIQPIQVYPSRHHPHGLRKA
jgi:hypothetical protein